MKIAEQLIKLIKEKGTNQRQVALKAKISPEYLGQIISGEVTNVGIEKIESLSVALDVHPMEILFPDEKRLYYASRVLEKHGISKSIKNSKTESEAPEVGFSQILKGEFFDVKGYPKGEWPRKIIKPEDVKDLNAYFIKVEDDSMEPFLRRGNRLLCVTNQEAHVGDYVCIQMLNNDVIIKELSLKNGMIILKPINPLQEPMVINKKLVKAIHPIVWIKRK